MTLSNSSYFFNSTDQDLALIELVLGTELGIILKIGFQFSLQNLHMEDIEIFCSVSRGGGSNTVNIQS